MKDILYTGRNATETHPWGLPGLGYVARTKAQIKNVALYEGIKWLLKLSKKSIEDGSYFHTTVEHYTKRYGLDYLGTVRGYIYEDHGKRYIEFPANCVMSKKITLEKEEARRYVERMSKVIPKSHSFVRNKR